MWILILSCAIDNNDFVGLMAWVGDQPRPSIRHRWWRLQERGEDASAERAKAKQIWRGFHHSWDDKKRTGTSYVLSVVTCSQGRCQGGGGACPPICGLPLSPFFPLLGSTKNKIGINFLYNYNSHCFEGTRTVHSGTFNCAFQSTPHRPLPNSVLMLCPWYRHALEPILSTVRQGIRNP